MRSGALARVWELMRLELGSAWGRGMLEIVAAGAVLACLAGQPNPIRFSEDLRRMLTVVQVLAPLVCARSWARELKGGHVRTLLLSPVRRRELFAAKTAVALAVFAGVTAAAGLFDGLYLLGLLASPGQALAVAGAVALRAAYVVAVSAMVAVLVRDTVLAVMLSLALLFSVDYLFTGPGFRAYNYVSTFNFFEAVLAAVLGRGFSSIPFAKDYVWVAVAYPLLTLPVSLGLALAVFARLDLD